MAASLWIAWGFCAYGGEEKQRVDPKPPAIKPVRWQKLNKFYHDVYIDGSGRPWFLFGTTLDCAVKPKSRTLISPEAPDDYIEIPVGNVPLGFDSRNRFWEIGKYSLCCTDVNHSRFFQRRPIGPDKLLETKHGRRDFMPFVWIMFEHSSGRLYFFDTNGAHTLDGKHWSYHRFSPPLPGINRNRSTTPSHPLRVVEGPRGEVYVWSAIYYETGSLWVHYGTTWTHYSEKDHPALGAIGRVIPQRDGTVRVEVMPGHEVLVAMDEPDWLPPLIQKDPTPWCVTRNARFQRGFDRNKLADVTGEELAAYGTPLGKDRDGRVYFRALPPFPVFGGFYSVGVFDARYSEDVPTLKYECMPAYVSLCHHVASFDSRRRVWARLSVKDYPFLSRYENGRWTHFPDPTGWAPERYPDHVLVHWHKTSWGMIRRDHYDRFRRHDWKAGPGMANPGLLQPLRNGGMVAVEAGGGRAFLFDGRAWKAYESPKELVEKNHSWLLRHLDNTAKPCCYVGTCVSLGRDATGRVWIGDQMSGGAYDGRQWDELPKGGFRLNASGDRATAGGFLLDSSIWPPKELIALPGNYPRGTWFDRRGRVWAQGDDPYFIHRCEGNRFVKIDSAAEGLPLLEDSAGRFWLCRFEGWYLLLPDGTTTELCRHPVAMRRAPVVEQGKGVFWAFASDGLLRLRVEEPTGGKPKIVVDTHYPRIVPQGEIRLLALDGQNNLWLATRSGKSGLYRIELPPVEGDTR